MKFAKIAIFLLSVSLWFSTFALAQGNQGAADAGGRLRGGQGGGPAAGRMYDPKTVETVTGAILTVDRIAGVGRMGGIHANLKTDKGETVPVHLGPAWYLDGQAMVLKPGDKVTVRGSRIVFDDKPAIIAAEITKDGRTLRLRDENGVPAWAGKRRRWR
jgi:hypothetical protein